MQAEQMKQRIAQLEQCADDAKRAVQSGNAPDDLRQCVQSFHQQASQAKHQPQMNDGTMRDTIVQLEQLADRAMDACRKAGNTVDGATQQAVKRMHEEASSLKHELTQHA